MGDIPILGRLFGSQRDDGRKTEIVLSVTPRVVRNPQLYDVDNLEYWSGTETGLRNGTISLKGAGTSGVMGAQTGACVRCAAGCADGRRPTAKGYRPDDGIRAARAAAGRRRSGATVSSVGCAAGQSVDPGAAAGQAG